MYKRRIAADAQGGFALVSHYTKGDVEMVFVLDVGNTNIVFGGMKHGEVIFTGRLSTDRNKTEEEYAIMFKTIMDINNSLPEGFEGAIISSVVPPLSAVLQKAVRLVTGKTALIVGPGVKTGLNIKIDDPAQLGSDLAVAAVAALSEYEPPIIVFDLGTATTVSVIDENACFRGGLLMPGVMISQSALSSNASQLPYISLDSPPNRVIGSSTIECMKSGLVHGNAAMIDGVIQRVEEELGRPATVVATGGLAVALLPYCHREIHYDPQLLLKGLWCIYAKNR